MQWTHSQSFDKQHPLLQNYWPPVSEKFSLKQEFAEFIHLDAISQQQYLISLRNQAEAHGKFLQTSLSTIYAYWFGYADSITHLKTDDVLESKIQLAKIQLEREMLDYWLSPIAPPENLNQQQAADYLKTLINNNTGVFHSYFDFIRDEMSLNKMIEFLKFETIRNEVVDDEVALIVVGLQAQMKNVMTSNLWDECGNGDVERFHTHWLRRLLASLGTLDEFISYRDTKLPWFTSITSNSFNMMATRLKS